MLLLIGEDVVGTKTKMTFGAGGNKWDVFPTFTMMLSFRRTDAKVALRSSALMVHTSIFFQVHASIFFQMRMLVSTIWLIKQLANKLKRQKLSSWPKVFQTFANVYYPNHVCWYLGRRFYGWSTAIMLFLTIFWAIQKSFHKWGEWNNCSISVAGQCLNKFELIFLRLSFDSKFWQRRAVYPSWHASPI